MVATTHDSQGDLKQVISAELDHCKLFIQIGKKKKKTGIWFSRATVSTAYRATCSGHSTSRELVGSQELESKCICDVHRVTTKNKSRPGL